MTHMLMDAPGWLALPFLAAVFVAYGVLAGALARRHGARRPSRRLVRPVGTARSRRHSQAARAHA